MQRSAVPLEEINRLLPNLEELEGLRASLLGVAVSDPDKEWASSSAYATVDKRVLFSENLASVLQEAEEAVQQRVASVFAACRSLLEAIYAGDIGTATRCLISSGEEEEARERLVRAQQFFEAALRLCLPLPDKRLQILALRRIGRILLRRSEYGEALMYYNRSAELAGDTGQLREEVIARTGSGNVFLFQGRWAEAEMRYRLALERLEAEDRERSLLLERGQLYNNLAAVATQQNRFPEADQWFKKALEVWATVDSIADLGVCLHNRGTFYLLQGDLENSRAVLHRAVELPVPPHLRSLITLELVRTYLAAGFVNEAEAWGREAEEQAIISQSPYHLGHMYCGLGNIARAKRDEGGVTFFEKALEIARETPLRGLEGEVLVDYALLRNDMGDREEALAYLERAREILLASGEMMDLERAEKALREITDPDELALAAT